MYAPAAMNGIVIGANTPTATDPAIATFLLVLSISVIYYNLLEMYLSEAYSVCKFGMPVYWVLHTVGVDNHEDMKFQQRSGSLCLELCSSELYVLIRLLNINFLLYTTC